MSDSPKSYASNVVINEQIVHIRPISGADIEVEKQFVRHADPEGRYQRLLHQATAAPELVEESFHGIDFDNRIAFVAKVKSSDGEERPVGVARYGTDQYGHCEASVIVAAEWEVSDLDQVLMRALIDFARHHKKDLIYAIDRVDNSHMHTLARDIGMTAQRDPSDAGTMRYELLLKG